MYIRTLLMYFIIWVVDICAQFVLTPSKIMKRKFACYTMPTASETHVFLTNQISLVMGSESNSRLRRVYRLFITHIGLFISGIVTCKSSNTTSAVLSWGASTRDWCINSEKRWFHEWTGLNLALDEKFMKSQISVRNMDVKFVYRFPIQRCH